MRTLRFAVVSVMIATASMGVAIMAWQVRDAGTTPTAASRGSGVVTGIVLTDTADPQPVRRATVRLSGAGSTVRTVGTDDEGRFAFDRLPAGPVTLSVSKIGFVTAFHGSTLPGRGPGVPVAVADGGTVDVAIRLLPGAVITGTITDSRGGPAAGVTVAAVDTRGSGSTPTIARVVTDDRGLYRIFGLAPGEYLVSALPQLVPASDGRGVASGVGVMAVTDADVQRARNANTIGAPGNPSASTRPVAYAPVFYPGTTDAASAVTLDVTSGTERAGVDLPLTIAPLARLSGTLLDASGSPVPSATVSLVPRRGDRPSPVDALVASGAVAFPRAIVAASAFSFTGVAPGQYTLVARTGSGQRGMLAADAAAPTLWSVTDITIDGTDRADVALRLLPGLSVTGRLTAAPGSAPLVDPAALNLSLVTSNPIPGVASTLRAIVQPNGTFLFPSLPPGNYLARIDPTAAAATARWALTSAVVGGRDVADRPLAVVAEGNELSGVLVTVTTRAAELAGRLVDASGQPVTRYSIIVFTQDRSLWLPNARRIRTVRPATDGSFTVAGLPPGDYAIAAVERADDADVTDAGFLSPLLEAAFRVTLAPGVTARQDFRVGG